MHIVSWNINGIRAALKKGFLDYLENEHPDILGVQEVRADLDAVPPEVQPPPGYQAYFSPAEKKGYSGVGLFTKTAPQKIWTDLGISEFDREGRLIAADFGDFILYNINNFFIFFIIKFFQKRNEVIIR